MDFAATNEDILKYKSIFKRFANNENEYLSKEKALTVFLKSGMSKIDLGHIIQLIAPNQLKLSENSFCMIMHVIICKSKRGLNDLPTDFSSIQPWFKLLQPAHDSRSTDSFNNNIRNGPLATNNDNLSLNNDSTVGNDTKSVQGILEKQVEVGRISEMSMLSTLDVVNNVNEGFVQLNKAEIVHWQKLGYTIQSNDQLKPMLEKEIKQLRAGQELNIQNNMMEIVMEMKQVTMQIQQTIEKNRNLQVELSDIQAQIQQVQAQVHERAVLNKQPKAPTNTPNVPISNHTSMNIVHSLTDNSNSMSNFSSMMDNDSNMMSKIDSNTMSKNDLSLLNKNDSDMMSIDSNMIIGAENAMTEKEDAKKSELCWGDDVQEPTIQQPERRASNDIVPTGAHSSEIVPDSIEFKADFEVDAINTNATFLTETKCSPPSTVRSDPGGTDLFSMPNVTKDSSVSFDGAAALQTGASSDLFDAFDTLSTTPSLDINEVNNTKSQPSTDALSPDVFASFPSPLANTETETPSAIFDAFPASTSFDDQNTPTFAAFDEASNTISPNHIDDGFTNITGEVTLPESNDTSFANFDEAGFDDSSFADFTSPTNFTPPANDTTSKTSS